MNLLEHHTIVMMLEKQIPDKAISTSISLPMSLYFQLMAKAQLEHISFSELIRRALFKEFEQREKDLGEE